MSIKKIQGNQSFKGIRISKNMPSEIVKVIKENPVIKRAGKNYSIWFNYGKDFSKQQNIAIMTITTPNTDSAWRVMTTPPHSIKRASYYLGMKTNGILNELENIKKTPDFFEKRVGTPRTFKQKLRAFIEALKIRFMPENRTVTEEVKLHKMLDKYKNMNMPK